MMKNIPVLAVQVTAHVDRDTFSRPGPGIDSGQAHVQDACQLGQDIVVFEESLEGVSLLFVHKSCRKETADCVGHFIRVQGATR